VYSKPFLYRCQFQLRKPPTLFVGGFPYDLIAAQARAGALSRTSLDRFYHDVVESDVEIGDFLRLDREPNFSLRMAVIHHIGYQLAIDVAPYMRTLAYHEQSVGTVAPVDDVRG
jgi:hypothetical protein